MLVDKTTLYDLSVFHKEEEYSLFKRIDNTKTQAGKQVLHQFFSQPLGSLNEIKQVQETLKIISRKLEVWPKQITNGTLLIIDKFLDDSPANIPQHASPIDSYLYKWLHRASYSMILFSVKQLFEFIQGYNELISLFSGEKRPANVEKILNQVEYIMNHHGLLELKEKNQFADLTTQEVLRYGRFFHIEFHTQIRSLILYYGTLDAWYSMAVANKLLQLNEPFFVERESPSIDAVNLRHLMLTKPVSYNITLNEDKNFIFLTGANMAGKSTLIKGLGLAVYLAHIGMGVPAEKMELTLFDGILSNINVEDNIIKGESYFFNEVKRIRETLLRISDGKRWLVLIDELFKGTNIQDAMKCSEAVISGLVKFKNVLFILSTHLYEIGEDLKQYPSISFKYFETTLNQDELHFSYQLKKGISNDRMGFLILKKEGVLDLLNQLSGNTEEKR
ncbi:MAG: DNA mismatch repair protein MutS [Chitinophagaceae bacterium]|nr:MAG: DNA mismatch repair protein MutS [Chitinophagaceae bacterium]